MAAPETLSRYTVISADTHAGADLYDYKPYLPQVFYDDFDAWAKTYASPFDDLIIATAKRNWDNELRISEMNDDGVAAELLLPNTVPPFFPTSPNITISLPQTREDFERRWAGVQAHNRWQVDFCSLAPARRRGLIQIFPNDVETALDEIRWGHQKDCFGGVLLPAVSPGDPNVAPLFHTRYEPIWELCSELDLTIVQHGGPGSPAMPMDQPASNAVLITEMALWAQRTLGHLILAGVFERHPTLRFVPTEQGTLWVQQQLMTLDAMVPTLKTEAGNRTYGMFGGSSVDQLTLTPTEYVQRNCYLASELTPFESGMIDFMGADHILWGSDYPHEEGFAPHSKLAIRWALHDRSEDECRKILAENAGRLYRFDLDALAPIAAEIGPAVAEVHTPLEKTGYHAPAAFGYRPFEGGLALKRLAPQRG
ncbi:amidohydrolase family protein [Mycobacterium sp. 1081908.1]|uniref:amidohydrolase family protein n=1 Tax=Mycobacterium sp. 1081908.1 TaxID=1834066 RepID=UPI0007FE52F5|nr:amidohydrolase family protein [Mycobacterium sp. 1081908.1]OBK48187.1 amidohydrolase [Mycobacterium sp. 1081908.1]